jgi:hypothetical protein
MKNELNLSLWKQFGASIEMLENAIKKCPNEHWNTEKRFWYNAFHCLFFLDYYLCTTPKNFCPLAPFTESEFEDRMPERVYTKVELLNYLTYSQKKAKSLILGLSEEGLQERWINSTGNMDYSIFEILLYNMRHLQHHAAQLNLILRLEIGDAPEWVSRI